jgi:hypothetical protein
MKLLEQLENQDQLELHDQLEQQVQLELHHKFCWQIKWNLQDQLEDINEISNVHLNNKVQYTGATFQPE